MKKWRGLCIGAGYFSQYHFDAWRRIPEVDIVGICDQRLELAQAAARLFPKSATCTDAREALQQWDVDFVDIITSPSSHRELIELAASSKRAIICQKPFATDLATARDLVRLAEDRGCRLMVHENFRFQPWHREIRRLLQSGAIGDRLHTLYFRSRPGDGWQAEAYLHRQPYFRQMRRFLIEETGVHFVDTFRFLAGEVKEVDARLRRLNREIAGEDTALLRLEFQNGAIGVWDANRFNESTAEDPRFTFGEFLIEGSGGTIRLYANGRLTVHPLGQTEQEHPYVYSRSGFAGECVLATQRHFIECLADGQPFETNARDYLKNLEVVDAAYRSAADNRPVSVGIEQSAVVSSSSRRVIDLSIPIDNQLRGAQISTFKQLEADGWNATTLNLYSHCGTHVDAPRHFLPQGPTLDQQSLEVCCGPARVLDLTPVSPAERIGPERLRRWADQIRPGDRLLLRTDWHLRLGSDEYRQSLPRISVELAEWLVARKVILLGVEPPSVADVNNIEELTRVHQILLAGGILIVEGLANLNQLRQEKVEFIALPLCIRGGDGCPVRAIAIEQT